MTEGEMRLDDAAVSSDLSLEIRNPNVDDQTFTIKVETHLLKNYRKIGEWTLQEKAADIVQSYMNEFMQGSTSEERLASLRGAGMQLFTAIPRRLQDLFWELIDSHKRFRSIFVFSQERNIPWELMVPHRILSDGTEEIRDPLGVEFNVGRWQEERGSESQLAPLYNSRVVAPMYVGELRLSNSQPEASFVCKLFNGERISPARVREINDQLENWEGTLLHFVCHGVVGTGTTVDQVILLDFKQQLSPTQVYGMLRARKAIRDNHPVVFINACDTGQQPPALIGAGGFAKAFTDIGARAVIAPLWSVKDTIAHEIAVRFYKEARANPRTPFSEILRCIRAKAYDESSGAEDTYAAYCLYGDPLLSMEHD